MTPDSEPTEKGRLATIRIIWAALLIGQLAFLGVIVLVLWKRQPPAPRLDEHVKNLLFYVAAGMLLTMVPIGWFVRSTTFRAARERAGTSSVPGPAYVTGNIIFWAMCEGASFVGLVGALLNNGPWPHLIVSIIAMAIQVLTFPTGAPMRDERV